MTIECFAQRLLNPYRGVMQTIRYASAEAVSLDGVHWDIYVANGALLEGLQVNHWTQITDIRYGSWSQEKGLKRGPLYPSDDFLRLEEMGATVYRHLTGLGPPLSFVSRRRRSQHYQCRSSRSHVVATSSCRRASRRGHTVDFLHRTAS